MGGLPPAARLLAGEMPEELEAAFGEAGAPLFPERRGDLETHCTCPDHANPCKHIAAVYLLLAEEFDRDPWLLLRLRGLDRSDVLDALGPEAEDPAALPRSLGNLPFWRGEEPLIGTLEEVYRRAREDALELLKECEAGGED